MVDKLNIEEIKKLLEYISKGYKVPKIVYDTIWEIAKREVEDKNKVVLVKRDPDTARDRIQAMYVKIIEGDSIEIYPAGIGAFGGDFDGDAMNLYVPVSEEAQLEAKSKMIRNMKNDSMNSPKFDLSKEVLAGLFTLTYEAGNNSPKFIKSAEEAYNLPINTIVNFNNGAIKTTAGRVVFNDQLPTYMGYIDKPVDKKEIKKILSYILENKEQDFLSTLHNLMITGFRYSTTNAKTISLNMFQLNDELKDLKVRLSKETDINKQSAIIKEMDTKIIDYIKKNEPDLYIWVASGAAKDVSQLRQMMISKGLISDSNGNVLPPVVNSISEGYSPQTYFDAAAGSRQGLISKAIGTADGGYEYRKVLFAIGNVLADPSIADCGTRNTLNVKLTKDLYKRLQGRYILVDNKINRINEDMLSKVISLRSPIYCESKNICRTCYGDLIKQVKSKNVGIVAAQEVASLAESHMKAFHLGGIVDLKLLNIQKELLNNVSDTFESKINKYTKQETQDLITNVNASIVINSSMYIDKYKIEETNEFYRLPVAQFILTLEDLTIPVSIDQEVFIYKNSSITNNDNIITINYQSGDKLFKVGLTGMDYSKIASKLDELIGGKVPFVDIPSLYMSFYKTLSSTGGWDSTHLEVLISNVLRNRKDPKYPARLKKPFDPKMFSIKSLPSIISWPLGIAFENFSKSIQYGMISERGEESPIEKVMFGGNLVK